MSTSGWRPSGPGRAAGAPATRCGWGGASLAIGRGVAGRPDFLKPNTEELAELTGSHEPLRATQDARRRGAGTVIASLGAEGLLAVTPEGRWRATPPAPLTGNPTGAGDAAVAGLLSALVEHRPWPERLIRAGLGDDHERGAVTFLEIRRPIREIAIEVLAVR